MRRPWYQSFLAFGFASLTVGCASTGAVPQPFPRPGAGPSWAPPRTAGTAPGDGYTIAGMALSLRGAPYRDGGADPSGFDCSGFITYVFGQHGIAIPRTVTLQFAAGESVQRDELRAGDLVFFSTTAPGPSHVGMLIGGDEFVHAPSTRGEVRVERLQSTYWAQRFIGARRLVR
ncbi:MAG: C40 family peptidase [Acidobacteria bacterium]|nr:C40 family peptidase [Acidobacteriota bacterium]MCA1650762.1 C40 family peptidase [Acidobacteriota bacterium]